MFVSSEVRSLSYALRRCRCGDGACMHDARVCGSQVVTATMVVCGEPSCAEWQVQALAGLQFPSHQNHVAQIWVSIAPLLAVDLTTRLAAVNGTDTSDATAARLQAGQQLLQGVRLPRSLQHSPPTPPTPPRLPRCPPVLPLPFNLPAPPCITSLTDLPPSLRHVRNTIF